MRTRLAVEEELLLSSGDLVFSLTIEDSYGLKLDLRASLEILLLFPEDGGVLFSLEESFLLDFDFSEAAISLELGASAPIWLHVWASSANGLFLASNCKQKKILVMFLVLCAQSYL